MPIKIIEDVGVNEFKQKAEDFKSKVLDFDTLVNELKKENITDVDIKILSNELLDLSEKAEQLSYDLASKAETFSEDL